MKLNKIIMFVMAMLCLSSMGYSELNDNLEYGSHFNSNTATDWTGNGVNAIVSGTTATTDKNSISDQALDFDGVTSYVDVGQPLEIDSGEFTLSIWFQTSATTGTHYLYDNIGDLGGHTNNNRMFMSIDANLLRVFMRGTTLTELNYNNPADGSWKHALVTRDGSGNVELYINGVSQDTGTTSEDLSQGRNWQIGRQVTAGYFDGKIDEPMMWSRALSSAEVEELYFSYNPLEIGLVDYWDFESLTGVNGNTLTNNGATLVSDDFDSAYDFDGTDDYLTTGDNLVSGYSSLTVGAWFNSDTAVNGVIIGEYDATGSRTINIGLETENEIRAIVGDSSNNIVVLTSTGNLIQPNTNYYVSLTYNLGDVYLYLDGVLVASDTSTLTGNLDTSNTDFFIGQRKTNTELFEGLIDEVSIYDRALSNAEVLALYNNDGDPTAVVTGDVPTLTSDITDFYNTSTIDITLSNDGNLSKNNISMSYSLNGGSSINLGETINTTFQVTGIEGLNNISFSLVSDTGNSTLNETFTIDTIAPVINIIGNLTQNDFLVNFSTIFNATDVNEIVSCTLNSTYLENVTNASDYDQVVDCTDTTTYGAAGTYNGFLTATDIAGNVGTLNVTGIIEPFVYINFFNTNTSPITNYTVSVTSPNGVLVYVNNTDNPTAVSPFLNGVLDLGQYEIEFSKFGYQTQVVYLDINVSSGGSEQNYTMNDAQIRVSIRDKDTGEVISGTEFTLEFIATVGLTTTTSTGLVNITNTLFIDELYTLIVTDTVYSPESVFFTFSNREVLDLDVYLTLENTTNAGILSVKVLDNNGDTVEDALVIAKQWFSDSSSFEATSQAQTGINGKTQLNILLNTKSYKISAYKDGEFFETSQHTYTSTDLEDVLVLTLTPSVLSSQKYVLEDITASAFDSFDETTNTTTISFTWQDANNLDATGCINTYRTIGGHQTLINSDCSTAASITYLQGYTLNTSQDIIIKAEMLIGGNFHTIDGFVYNSDNNPATILKNIGFDIFIVPILFIVSIVVAFATKNVYIGAILMVLSAGLSLTLAPGILTGGVVAFCMVIGIIVLFGGA